MTAPTILARPRTDQVEAKVIPPVAERADVAPWVAERGGHLAYFMDRAGTVAEVTSRGITHRARVGWVIVHDPRGLTPMPHHDFDVLYARLVRGQG